MGATKKVLLYAGLGISMVLNAAQYVTNPSNDAKQLDLGLSGNNNRMQIVSVATEDPEYYNDPEVMKNVPKMKNVNGGEEPILESLLAEGESCYLYISGDHKEKVVVFKKDGMIRKVMESRKAPWLLARCKVFADAPWDYRKAIISYDQGPI